MEHLNFTVLKRDLVWYVTAATTQPGCTLIAVDKEHDYWYRVLIEVTNEPDKRSLCRIVSNFGKGFTEE